jgi:hypothetical protein
MAVGGLGVINRTVRKPFNSIRYGEQAVLTDYAQQACPERPPDGASLVTPVTVDDLANHLLGQRTVAGAAPLSLTARKDVVSRLAAVSDEPARSLDRLHKT